MKLKILAAVVAGTFAIPMVAQAGTIADTMSLDGDIGVFYDTSIDGIQELGTELNFDGSAEVDGITYMGHMELDVNGTRSGINMDEVRVGAKGGFGEVWLGDVDNACDQFDPGSNDIWLGTGSSSCGGSDVNNIVYKGTAGPAQFAVSHNPNADQSAIGAKFGMGPVSVNLAYEDGAGVGSDDNRVSYGVSYSNDGFHINAEGNDDDAWGVNAGISMNGNTFWGGVSNDDNFGIGYRRSHGKMDYIIEHRDYGNSDQTIAGLRYRF